MTDAPKTLDALADRLDAARLPLIAIMDRAAEAREFALAHATSAVPLLVAQAEALADAHEAIRTAYDKLTEAMDCLKSPEAYLD